MTRVKICGLTTEADLETAVEAGADAVGFVCDVPVDTPREIGVGDAMDLVAATPPFVTSVLVTMATDRGRTIDLVEAVEPDAVQLHGSVEPDVLASLRTRVDVTLFLSVDADDLHRAAEYDDVVDAIVVDTTDEHGAGGTGEPHDWDRTRAAVEDLTSPVILAGGLTPENAEEAIRTVDPFAVDVASGVESTGGRKDPDAVRTFVARATSARRPAEPESGP